MLFEGLDRVSFLLPRSFEVASGDQYAFEGSQSEIIMRLGGQLIFAEIEQRDYLACEQFGGLVAL